MVTIRSFWIYTKVTVLGLFFYSCSNDDIKKLDSYTVIIKNHYFETVDSIRIGSNFVSVLEINEVSQPFILEKQQYQFSCLTRSKLILTAKIDVRGSKENLIIEVLNNGKITLGN